MKWTHVTAPLTNPQNTTSKLLAELHALEEKLHDMVIIEPEEDFEHYKVRCLERDKPIIAALLAVKGEILLRFQRLEQKAKADANPKTPFAALLSKFEELVTQLAGVKSVATVNPKGRQGEVDTLRQKILRQHEELEQRAESSEKAVRQAVLQNQTLSTRGTRKFGEPHIGL